MTMEIPLSRGYVALVDDEDYARVMAAGPWYANCRDQWTYGQHNVRQPGGRWRTEALHIFITGLRRVDHINGNGLDNTRANLRYATPAQNAANARQRRDSTSGFKGVHRNGPRGLPWRAQIAKGGKKRHLGLFESAEIAARAYDAAALELFGEFARLNFPQESS